MYGRYSNLPSSPAGEALILPNPLPRIGFVGAGRLASCLAIGFSRAGYPVSAVASRTPGSAAALAGQIANCAACAAPQQVVDAADIVFLAVPDDRIGATANALLFAPAASPSDGDSSRAGAWALVHCSGASPVELLDSVRHQGAETGGFHPLYLFGGNHADIERIAGCSVTIEADGKLNDVLAALARALGCHPLSVPRGSRMLYHGAAHYAASFALCSLAECVELWSRLGFSEDHALRALLPMLAGTIETARDKGLAGALAGPVSRGDVGVVAKQLAVFEELGGDHATLYALLTRRAVALARRRAQPPAALDAIAGVVEASLAGASRGQTHAPEGAGSP